MNQHLFQICIPYEYREAMRMIDEALTVDVCSDFVANTQPRYRAKWFATECFYYLDTLGNRPITAVSFHEYFADKGLPNTAGFILSRILKLIKGE